MKGLVTVLLLGILTSCHTTRQVSQAYHNDHDLQGELTPAQAAIVTGTLSGFPDHSQMAIALIQNNKTRFYGVERQHDSLQTLENAHAVFEIGSLTKVFTTHLLMNARNEGLIQSLDAPIAGYGAMAIKDSPAVTFRELANHTSGLPGEVSGSIFNTDPANPYKRWNRQKLADFLIHEKLESAPGTKYTYSNVGMALLANTICTLRQQSYERLLQEEVFQPHGMTSTTTDRALIQDRLIQGYNWKGKPTANWDLAAMAGAGAILSTAEDLSRYLKWSFGALRNQFKPMRETTFTINDDLDIALGWHIIKGKTADPFLWHNGGTGGYKSSVAINPDAETAVVILTNIGANKNPKRGLIDNLCFDLMKSINS